jgi:hypothetical protein
MAPAAQGQAPKTIVRRVLIAFALVAPLAVTVGGALFTELGILTVGHRYWMSRAARSTNEARLADSIERVLRATQYGVNVAEDRVLEEASTIASKVPWTGSSTKPGKSTSRTTAPCASAIALATATVLESTSRRRSGGSERKAWKPSATGPPSATR